MVLFLTVESHVYRNLRIVNRPKKAWLNTTKDISWEIGSGLKCLMEEVGLLDLPATQVLASSAVKWVIGRGDYFL